MGDALGSLRQLADSQANITLSKSYEPFGSVLISTGAGASAYAFTGEQYDSVTGLVYLRARYYAPGVGRFMTRDTWAGDYNQPMSYNPWLYVYANSINLLDPNGQQPCEGMLITGGVVCNSPTTSNYDEKSPPPGMSFIGCDLRNVWLTDFENDKPISTNASGNQAQFIRLKGDNAKSYGLCGSISVAAIVGVSGNTIASHIIFQQNNVNEALNVKWVSKVDGKDLPTKVPGATRSGHETRGNSDWYVWRDDAKVIVLEMEVESAPDPDPNYVSNAPLVKIINKYYGDRMRATIENVNAKILKEKMPGWLDRGSSLITGTFINGSTGRLQNNTNPDNWLYVDNCKENNNCAAHWWVITGYSTTWHRSSTGKGDSVWQWVRVYNPFDNQTEYYWWGDFKLGFQGLGGIVKISPLSLSDRR